MKIVASTILLMGFTQLATGLGEMVSQNLPEASQNIALAALSVAVAVLLWERGKR